ncbi:hypothetical protein [Clostridium muellerianum]|nr:hypothetical protein [Clostridium muellerianum]
MKILKRKFILLLTFIFTFQCFCFNTVFAEVSSDKAVSTNFIVEN